MLKNIYLLNMMCTFFPADTFHTVSGALYSCMFSLFKDFYGSLLLDVVCGSF
jgi:hypothetical protein